MIISQSWLPWPLDSIKIKEVIEDISFSSLFYDAGNSGNQVGFVLENRQAVFCQKALLGGYLYGKLMIIHEIIDNSADLYYIISNICPPEIINMRDMLSINGSHGTTASKVKSIETLGWRDGVGKAGSGVYFWKECEHYIPLAIGWYKQALSQGRYKGDDTRECRVIIANMEAQESEVLDLDNRELRESVYRLVKEKKLPHNSTKELTRVYDMFITALEHELGVKFKILLMEVPPPDIKYLTDYPIRLLGFPICCVARDLDIIGIADIIKCREG